MYVQRHSKFGELCVVVEWVSHNFISSQLLSESCNLVCFHLEYTDITRIQQQKIEDQRRLKTLEEGLELACM